MSSYKAVCGHKFNHEFACSKEEARRCWALDECMQVTNDKEFEETKMMGIWIVMMTALPRCFSSSTGRSQQGSILILVCLLPVLLHLKRRGGDNMRTS